MNGNKQNMLIEQNTNYAYKLKYMEHLTFDKVRDLAARFVNELPLQLKEELYDALNRGVDILDSEPQMVTYLFSFGKMHQAKLDYAFDNLPEVFLQQKEINIIDYGCGQALGTMCYSDFLHKRNVSQKVKTITLIEPSEMCLKRAALHASAFFPDAVIKTVSKKFDDLDEDDICCEENIPTLHILSNVLDMTNFDLEGLAYLVENSIKGYSQFVCVGPYFNHSGLDNRMEEFRKLLNGNVNFSTRLDKYELHPDKTWTAQLLCFSVGELEEEELSSEMTMNTLEHQNKKADFSIKNVEAIFISLGWTPKWDYSKVGQACIMPAPRRSQSARRQESSETQAGNNNDFSTRLDKNELHPDKPCLSQTLCYSEGELEEELSTEVTKEDIENGIEDEFGVVYSKDGKRLLKCKNDNLEKYAVKNGTRVIGDWAFNRKEILKQIFIPDTVIHIGNYSFSVCTSLQSIFISDSVTHIGDNAFHYCKSLQQISIPDSITNLGKEAFIFCCNLEQIKLSKSITNIADNTFLGCSSLNYIHLPESVTTIGDKVFLGCASLKQIYLPESVISIGEEVFHGCETIQEIHIPSSITSIGNYVFCGCSSLKKINIPNSLKKVGANPFVGCTVKIESQSKRFIYQEGFFIDLQNKTLISYVGKRKKNSIPNIITNIGLAAFGRCSFIQEIHIPSSISNISNEAFCYCSSLKKINIPNSIKKVGTNPFVGCTVKIESKSKRFIYQEGFFIDLQNKTLISYVDKEKVISISNLVVNIGAEAFRFCSLLQQITIPDSVTSIGVGAFDGCRSLQRIIIPKGGVERIKHLLPKVFWDKLYFHENVSDDSEDIPVKVIKDYEVDDDDDEIPF